MNKLFSDLKTDEEKSNFFLSGRGYETGVIAPAIQNDVAMAYHRCAEYEKEVQALRKDAERYRATRAGLMRIDEDYGERFSAYFESKGISQASDITEDDFDAATDAAMETQK